MKQPFYYTQQAGAWSSIQTVPEAEVEEAKRAGLTDEEITWLYSGHEHQYIPPRPEWTPRPRKSKTL
jgi:hypothetical protein